MALSSKWANLDHFGPNENWGDPTKMKSKFLRELDDYREFIKRPIFISQGSQGTHAKNSIHYDGLAADILFPGTSLKDLPDLLLQATRFAFKGIGFYPYWNYHGDRIGGLHLDMRPTELVALWSAYLSPDPYKPGKQQRIYAPLTFKAMHQAVHG